MNPLLSPRPRPAEQWALSVPLASAWAQAFAEREAGPSSAVRLNPATQVAGEQACGQNPRWPVLFPLPVLSERAEA